MQALVDVRIKFFFGNVQSYFAVNVVIQFVQHLTLKLKKKANLIEKNKNNVWNKMRYSYVPTPFHPTWY